MGGGLGENQGWIEGEQTFRALTIHDFYCVWAKGSGRRKIEAFPEFWRLLLQVDKIVTKGEHATIPQLHISRAFFLQTYVGMAWNDEEVHDVDLTMSHFLPRHFTMAPAPDITSPTLPKRAPTMEDFAQILGASVPQAEFTLKFLHSQGESSPPPPPPPPPSSQAGEQDEEEPDLDGSPIHRSMGDEDEDEEEDDVISLNLHPKGGNPLL